MDIHPSNASHSYQFEASRLERNMAEALANLSLGGYDEEFVNAVEDELQCAICQLPLKEPVLTKCGHRFCKQCLNEHFKRLAFLSSVSVV